MTKRGTRGLYQSKVILDRRKASPKTVYQSERVKKILLKKKIKKRMKRAREGKI